MVRGRVFRSLLFFFFTNIFSFIFLYFVFAVVRREGSVMLHFSADGREFVYAFYIHNTFVAMPRVLLYDTLNIYKFM